MRFADHHTSLLSFSRLFKGLFLHLYVVQCKRSIMIFGDLRSSV